MLSNSLQDFYHFRKSGLLEKFLPHPQLWKTGSDMAWHATTCLKYPRMGISFLLGAMDPEILPTSLRS